ncbi:MAG: alpha/beta fold hydrolase [Ignavibacteria bacterium]|nr:alpha/beta fold hydrolase [Ignavibacteria bacterium]NNL22735.1 alpha/beta fold hydrolase [Ignavibacteriaceae bacterium]
MNSTINNLAYFTDGDKNKKPIVFVHGFPFDHFMWDEQAKALCRDFYCVRYDIRGLGVSPSGDGQFTMESFVDDLELIMYELNLNKPVLCGLSMGGYISLRSVERMHDKFGALILCDTKDSADDNEGKLKRAAAIKQINSGGFENFIDSFVLNCFGEEYVKANKSGYDAVVKRSKKNNPIGVKGCVLAMAGRTATTHNLSKINLPTLVICGNEDKLSPPNVMKSMADQIPNSNFVLVKDAGHMTPIEKPKEVNDAIGKFLDSLE